MGKKRDLSKLPLRFQKFGKNWKDITTGKVIPDSKITDYLPRPIPDHESIMSRRYDLNY